MSEALVALRRIWLGALRRAWARRWPLTIATLAIWIPCGILAGWMDKLTGFSEAVGLPLALFADAFIEPFYAGLILVILAAPDELTWSRGLTRALWLLPRLWLIQLKIAIWALAVPYLILHLGSAFLLTPWPVYEVAKGVIYAMIAGTGWLLVVVVAFMLAPAVLVAQESADGWTGSSSARGWVSGRSTGWTLWAARRLASRRIATAIMVAITGQAAILMADALAPPGEGVAMRLVDGVLMLSSTVWWALVWEFAGHCTAAPARNQD